MRSRVWQDKFGSRFTFVMAGLSGLILVLIIVGLVYKSVPVIKSNSITELLFSSSWKPIKGQFGFLPFIVSTVYITVLAMVLAVPVCLLTAIYLSEYASKRTIQFIAPLIDILAGIPSVIYGIWGIIMIIPFISDILAPALDIHSTGYSVLAGGIVLAVMVSPVIIHLLYEVLKSVRPELRDASLSLGAGKWETIKLVVLRKALPGILASVTLGFSRALGETIAVLMVVGNVVHIPKSPFDAGYPLPALIANNYGEMMSIPMYDSALMFAALILLVIIMFFNSFARKVLRSLEHKII